MLGCSFKDLSSTMSPNQSKAQLAHKHGFHLTAGPHRTRYPEQIAALHSVFAGVPTELEIVHVDNF